MTARNYQSSNHFLFSSLSEGLFQLILFQNKNFFPLLFTRRQILDSFKPKEFVEDNFKVDENGRKFSKREENTVGKGEIARNEQFLLFPQCFQKTCNEDT